MGEPRDPQEAPDLWNLELAYVDFCAHQNLWVSKGPLAAETHGSLMPNKGSQGTLEKARVTHALRGDCRGPGSENLFLFDHFPSPSPSP